ncbi:MAG: hypothetical protein NTW05_27625 [Pseudonocardiales bacterium]|nr:hypothetical protein [Pseudonocardiales bacterium]
MADDPDDAHRRVDDFDAIVAGWRRDGDVPAWPDEPPAPEAGTPAPDDDGPADPRVDPRVDPLGDAPVAAGPVADLPPAVHRPPTGPATAPEDEHFVPPEPPPMPRIGPPAAVGLGLLLIGLVLVTTPGWLGVPSVYGLPLGLLTLAAGLGWLVLRLWPTPPEDEDDDGARL